MSQFVFEKCGGNDGDAIYWDFRSKTRGEWWLSFDAIERKFTAWDGINRNEEHAEEMLAALPEEEKARAMALAVKYRGDRGI